MFHNTNLSSNDLYQYGNIFLANKRFLEAIQYYNLAISTSPIGDHSNLLQIFNNRATCYFLLNNFNNAITDYNKAITLAPYNLILRNNLTNAYMCNGQSGKALETIAETTNLLQQFSLFNQTNQLQNNRYEIPQQKCVTTLTNSC